MKKFSKVFSIVTASLMLLQSVSPVSFVAQAAESIGDTGPVIDVRFATIQLRDSYNTSEASVMDTLLTAMRLYAIATAGPSCVRQQQAANTLMILDRTDAQFNKNESLSTYANNTTTKTNISPICTEIFSLKDGDPSQDLMNIYEKFFQLFFPDIDLATVVQGAESSEDVDQYMLDILGEQAIQDLQDYIATGNIPNTPVCTLTTSDEQVYIQAKSEYIAAVDRQDAASAKVAFETMESIQSRGTCNTTSTDTKNISNPECISKISVLDAQIKSLDPQVHGADIARIQNTIQTLQTSPTCTAATRSQTPAISAAVGIPRLETNILNFQAAETVIPDTTPQFCQSTAFQLSQQLDTASYFTVNKLLDSINAIKPSLDGDKQRIATLVESLAVEKAAEKAQNLGLNSPQTAMNRFLSVGEMIANSVLTNQAAYKILDMVPLLDGYSNALDNTRVGQADSFDELQRLLDEGVRLIWDEGMKIFAEDKTSQPGLTIVARANETSNTNNAVVNVRQLSAYEFREWYVQSARSQQVTPQAPTLEQLQTLYFGSIDGSTTPYDGNNNRVWYEVNMPSTIDDATYTALLRNKAFYPRRQTTAAGIEIFDVNGLHIAVIPNHEARTVTYLPAGVYENEWTRIEVGANGLAEIMRESNSTFPRAIDASVTIDGVLTAALQGNIQRPEELSPIIATQEEKQSVREVTYGTTNSVTPVSQKYETTNKRYVERESMLPEKITGTLFLDPLTIEFSATRTYNADNGTNTITIQATMVGGATCGVQINGSATYYSNQYGVDRSQPSSDKTTETQEESNPFISASLNIQANGYKWEASSSQIQSIVDQVNSGQEPDLVSIVNDQISNQFSVLGMVFGSLSFGQDDSLYIDYVDQTSENFVDIVTPIIDRLDLGWVADVMDMFDDGGKESSPQNPTQDPMRIYVSSAYIQDSTYYINFTDEYGNMVNPVQGPTIYLTTCQDSCEVTSFDMMVGNDGYTYSYTLDPAQESAAVSITVEAYNKNNERAQYNFK